MGNKKFTPIPLEQGPTSILFFSTCAIFAFLGFLGYGMHNLFTPSTKLVTIENSPGYVIQIEQQDPNESVKQISLQHIQIVNEIISYYDDILGSKVFTIAEVSQTLGSLYATESKRQYISIPFARQANIDFAALKSDITELLPNSTVYDNKEFFSAWKERLTYISSVGKYTAAFAVITLLIVAMVLISGCIGLHRKTTQTLLLLGAEFSYISKKLQKFFVKKFIAGAVVGAIFAIVIFIPFAWVIDPSVNLGISLFTQIIGSVVVIGSGALITYALVKGIMLFGASYIENSA